MTAQEDLRKWLIKNGYCIPKETLVQEGKKRYLILSATGGASTPYTPGELWAGRQTRGEENPYRLAYLTDLIQRRKRALEGMERGSGPDPAALAAERALIDELEAMKETWNTWQR